MYFNKTNESIYFVFVKKNADFIFDQLKKYGRLICFHLRVRTSQ